MGKRKRRGDSKKPPPPPRSDSKLQALPEDPQSQARSSDQAESSATQPQASIMEVLDSPLKRTPGQHSPLNHNHGSSRTILLKHSRHPFGRHYSRRGSSSQSDASPSHWKGTPLYDPKQPYKFENTEHSNFPYRDYRNRIFQKPERIRATCLSEITLSGEVRNMECTICHKRLRKHPLVSEIVAVLFCGHMYHADCLEEKTSQEDQQDPPCLQCVSHKE